MPHASKSAVKHNIYSGDIATHIFKINPDSTAVQFNEDGTLSNPYVTLAFACYGCHVDENGIGGGTAPQKTLGELSRFAVQIHN